MSAYTVNKPEDWSEIIPKILQKLGNRRIFTIEGPMGSGKTTFTAVFMDYLESLDEVSSPTYGIVNEYNTINPEFLTVYHMDLYRLNSLEEAIALPIEDYLYSGNLCIIEWPELIESILPEDILRMQISMGAEGARNVVFL
jgi:tRNA threonylcarbamoyladenosine biosynthesis protein TsaE